MAGRFSACMESDGEFYVWGEGCFGKIKKPVRLKHRNKTIKDFRISNGGHAAMLCSDGFLYSWGAGSEG